MDLSQSFLPLSVRALLAVAVIAITLAPKSHAAEDGFIDVVKNPEIWKRFNENSQKNDKAVEEAQKWNDDEIATVIRHFLFDVPTSREAWGEARILTSLGPRTHATILEILADQNLYPRLVKPTGKDLVPEAPFNRACQLLGDSPPKKAVAKIGPFLNDPSEEIRKDAALAIAKTGTTEMIPYVQKALSDDEPYVRSYALMGLEYSLLRKNFPQDIAKKLFPDVQALLEAGHNADEATDILFQFGPSKATEFFLSKKGFRADSRILHEALETLAENKVPVPRDRLLNLIRELEAGELKFPHTYSLGTALLLLGQLKNPDDQDFLAQRMNHTNEQVAEGAANGLICLHGLEGFDQRVWDAEEKLGYDALPDHLRYYSAVFWCDTGINNGGIAGYFVNSGGDHWRDALAGLKAMGAKKHHDILQKAIALFRKNGPSEDRDKRQLQLSKLFEKDDAIFEQLETRYFKKAEKIQVLAIRFVLDHPESFR